MTLFILSKYIINIDSRALENSMKQVLIKCLKWISTVRCFGEYKDVWDRIPSPKILEYRPREIINEKDKGDHNKWHKGNTNEKVLTREKEKVQI